MHVHCWTPRRSVKTCSHVRVWNSCEVVLELVIFVYQTRAKLSSWASPLSSCQELLRYLFSSTLPVSSTVPQGTVTPEPGTLLLATSLPAASTNSRLVCSTPGSPRKSFVCRIVTLRLLLGSALPLSGLICEAPSGTAHEEHLLQVWFFLLLSLMLVVPVAL